MIIMDQIVSNIQGYNRDSGQDHRIGGWGGVHLFFFTISGLHIVPFHWVGLEGVLGSGTSMRKVFLYINII